MERYGPQWLVRKTSILSAFAAMTMLASNAQAKVFVPSILPAASMGLIENTCDSKIQSASLLSPEVAPVAAPQSKMTAILGGEMSALEMMRAQQANPSPKVAAAAAPGTTPTIAALNPAAGGVRQPIAISCLSASARTPDTIAEPVQAVQFKELVHTPGRIAPNDDFLVSKRVRIGRTHFDRQWRRVRGESLHRTLKKEFGKSMPLGVDAISRVNRWVNSEIEYVEDRDLFKKADYWAGAKRTLRLGKGDCEDYALTKMQLLAAAGIPRSDMYLTIARDKVRNADHALLVVKFEERYFVLDNATDELLDGASSHDYAPVLSFSGRSAWLHGY